MISVFCLTTHILCKERLFIFFLEKYINISQFQIYLKNDYICKNIDVTEWLVKDSNYIENQLKNSLF